MSQILIKNGRVIDPRNQIDSIKDLFIRNEHIVGIGQPPQGFSPDTIIDATNKWVMPGVVDTWARLRQPGASRKGTIASETRAAMHSGITTICLPPDTNPIIDKRSTVRYIDLLAQQEGHVQVLPIGALTKDLGAEQLAEMADLLEAGCVAISQADAPFLDTRILKNALEYAAEIDALVMMRPQDPFLNDGCAHDGQVASRLGLPASPPSTETIAVARLMELVSYTGTRVHLVNLSTARAVEQVRLAQQSGLPVTASVSAHQLWLTEMDIAGFDANCHIYPPLRGLRDRDALREGIADGTISVINSDHQPHDVDAKLAPFPSSEPGMSTLETLLPLTLKLIDEGVLNASQATSLLCSNPAKLLKQHNIGHLGQSAYADIAIINPEAFVTFNSTTMISKGKNSPFNHFVFNHTIEQIFFRGQHVVRG